ncbi:MAG: HU family DNA-binding protein [Chthoniobacterales bacterium]|nr:HU family DNA-binding protein [Chthoniobacterales bacterium]MCX7712261.1 HU family DNA-binding protein [Chthoniobacterales bacterium]
MDFASRKALTYKLFCKIKAELIQTRPNPSGKPMNKAELVEAVLKALGDSYRKTEIEKILATILEEIKNGVKKNKQLQLIGFGTFKVVNRKARKGVNPATGEAIKIKASKTVRFVPGKAFKESL